ncbi:MAG: exodeoxyribonuclease VII small subunit [Thermodesulfobacteriota bacterium]|nr:exodeoxyribonuclease VII small subunit [Thermodesulfobacteriota bacterium]
MSEQTFEDAMKQLESIVTELENGDIHLEESLNLFEQGVKLSRFCAKKLDEAQKKVEILLKDRNGNLIPQPFESMDEEGEMD